MDKETRVQMWCEECRQVDDHPRHHVAMADGSVQSRHMDCCRDAGKCTDSHCHSILTESGEKRGLALAKWIKENK